MKANTDEFTPDGHRSIKQQIADTWRAIKVSTQAAAEAQKKDPSREYMQRPARAVNIEGSVELAWGIFCLAGTLSIYLGSLQPRPPWVSSISWVLLATMCLAPLLVPKLVKRLITWPRSGYVALDPKNTRLARTMGLVLGAVFAIGFSILGIAERQHSSLTTKAIVAAFAVVLLLFFVFTWFRVKKACNGALAGQLPLVSPTSAPNPAEPPTTPIPAEKIKTHVRFGISAMLLTMFVVVPCVFGGIIYCWLHFTVNSHVHLEWSQSISMIIALVCNPLLYLMMNAVSVKKHKWKWFGFALLALGPLTILTLFPEVLNELSKPHVVIPNTLSFFIAAVWLISGTATLVLYIIHHPKTEVSME